MKYQAKDRTWSYEVVGTEGVNDRVMRWSTVN